MHYFFNCVFSNYLTFSGRARRAEFWYFQLVVLLLNISFTFLAVATGFLGHMLSLVVGLAIILPSFAVLSRRLHDTDRSAWWMLLGLIPLIGMIVLIVFTCQKGTAGDNRFGPDPLQSEPQT